MKDVVTHAIDLERFFTIYPIPDEYNNEKTKIRLLHGMHFDDFRVIIANPKLPPLGLNAEGKWINLTPPKPKREE
jgi:hypothetical protein